VGRPDWLAEPRYAGMAGREASAAELVANGYLAEIPADFGETVPVVANPVRYGATPVTKPGRAPELGQHTEEVLLELGYDWDQIGALRRAGAI
jgi:formyl-CoA transferase